MELYHDTAQDSKGNIINNATVTVTIHSSGAPATIYDKDGNALSNPFLSGYDRNAGEIDFAAADGLYDIQIVGGSTTTLKSIGLFDSDGAFTQTDADALYQPLDATLTALAGTLTAANKIPYATATDTAGELDFLDEDDMSSDSATAVPSQQSVKAYVDGQAQSIPFEYTSGLLWSNNGVDATNDFDVSVGESRSSDDTTNLVLSAGQTKQMDATWATGTNAGAITATAWGATGWVAGQSYHVFLAEISGTVEVIVDTDASGANIDTDHSSPPKRHIFSFLSEAGPTIPSLFTSEDGKNIRAVRDVLALDYNAAGSTGGATQVLSVPTGIKVLADINVFMSHTATSYSLITETAQTNSTPGASLHELQVTNGGQNAVLSTVLETNTSGQIRHRVSTSVTLYQIYTVGYTFRR